MKDNTPTITTTSSVGPNKTSNPDGTTKANLLAEANKKGEREK